MSPRRTLPPRITSRLLTGRLLARSRQWAAAKAAASNLSSPPGSAGANLVPQNTPTASAPAKPRTRRKRHLSAATRAKISRTMKGRKKPAATRAKISQTLKGHPVSARTRAKLSAAMHGHKMPARTRAKISRTLTGHPVSARTRAKISRTNILIAPRGEAHPSYRHGAYAAPEHPPRTLDDVIAELSARQARLSASLDRELAADQPDTPAVIRLLALASQNAGKLAQLLCYQQQLRSAAVDAEVAEAINQALDELAREFGWKV